MCNPYINHAMIVLNEGIDHHVRRLDNASLSEKERAKSRVAIASLEERRKVLIHSAAVIQGRAEPIRPVKGRELIIYTSRDHCNVRQRTVTTKRGSVIVRASGRVEKGVIKRKSNRKGYTVADFEGTNGPEIQGPVSFTLPAEAVVEVNIPGAWDKRQGWWRPLESKGEG